MKAYVTITKISTSWLKSINILNLFLIVLLAFLGLLFVTTASPSIAKLKQLEEFYFVKKHGVFMVLSIILLIGFSLLSKQVIIKASFFGASVCSFFLDIPIAHISGGDTSLGSKDETFRNSISLMSDTHFVKIDKHKKKLISLGIDKKNIIVTGSLSNENYVKKFDKKFFVNKPFVLITFHSVTNSKNQNDNNVQNLLNSLKKFKRYKLLFTSSNHDVGGKNINLAIKKFVNLNKNSIFIPNLGRKLYYQAMKECEFMIGNSSSGIIESMIYKKPAINILPRQLGRHSNNNVINCKNNVKDICNSIEIAQSKKFQIKCKRLKNFFKKSWVKPSEIMLKTIIKKYG